MAVDSATQPKEYKTIVKILLKKLITNVVHHLGQNESSVSSVSVHMS